MPDGPAAPSVFNATGRTSGPVICSYMTGRGSQGRVSEETIVDRSTDLASGYFSFSGTWRRSLLLNFSTCYLGVLGLEGAKNCILARTSHQRTTSEKRTKALLPKWTSFIQRFHCNCHSNRISLLPNSTPSKLKEIGMELETVPTLQKKHLLF